MLVTAYRYYYYYYYYYYCYNCCRFCCYCCCCCQLESYVKSGNSNEIQIILFNSCVSNVIPTERFVIYECCVLLRKRAVYVNKNVLNLSVLWLLLW